MTMRLSRRNVLKALGVFAALPVGKLLYRSIAQAQGVPPELRFIGVYHPHGIANEFWERRASETDTQFSLDFPDSVLAPFDAPQTYGRSFKDKIITLEGVDLAAAELSRSAGHGAAVTLFTGSMTTSSARDARGPSLDQHLARTLGLGTGTRFPTLNVGVGSSGDKNQDAIAHGPGGSVIRNELDPLVVFDRVFGTASGLVDQAQAMAARQRGQSVIDFVRGDLNALSSRLAPAERVKLEQHLDSVRDIETRLHAAQLTCVAPSRPRRSDVPEVERYRGGEPYFDVIGDLMIDLLAVAMACDATRFATLFLDGPGRAVTLDGVQIPSDVHNDVAHRYARGTSASAVATQVRLARLNRYYYAKIARLLQKLDAVGLLDSTLVLAGSDMGNPAAHSSRNIPLLIAGGANGRLVMGRRLRAGPDCPTGGAFCDEPDLDLTPHNRVLVSIAKLFGDPSASFGVGDAALTTGAFPGL